MNQWTLMGWFWIGQWAETFTGPITINDDGTFGGTLVDRFGKSTVTGKVFHSGIEFCKEYAKDSQGAPGKINYLLRASVVPAEGVPQGIPSGWKGTYTFHQHGRPHHGEAACMMFPAS